MILNFRLFLLFYISFFILFYSLLNLSCHLFWLQACITELRSVLVFLPWSDRRIVVALFTMIIKGLKSDARTPVIRSRAPPRAISNLPVKRPTGRGVGVGCEVSGRPAGFKTLNEKFSNNYICSKILKKNIVCSESYSNIFKRYL